MSEQVRVPDSVYRTAVQVQEDYDYPSLGEAIRHMCRAGDYDV